MTVQFKNRLIGTIVLVALLVIVIPDILDGKKEHVKEEFNSIPFAPEASELPPLVIELDPPAQESDPVLPAEPGPAVVVEEIAPVETAQVERKPVVKTTAKARIESKTISLEQNSAVFDKSAWVIQIATLKSAERTQWLVQQIRQGGYRAFSYPTPAVDGELNRVFVGPDVSKQALQAQLPKINKLTKLEGLLRRYDPIFGR